MTTAVERKVLWVSSSRADLKAFPEEVRIEMGYALYLAQTGGKHRNAKPLKGYVGAGVLEMVDDDDGNTYRCVYTVRFEDHVYVLHAFQKKSKRGIATPASDMALIDRRLRMAEEDHRRRRAESQ